MLKYTSASGRSASSIGGSVSVRMKYQMNNCNNSGTLRKNSTYTLHSVRTRKLRDSLPMPISVPSNVASTMPTTATRKVLDRPTRNALA